MLLSSPSRLLIRLALLLLSPSFSEPTHARSHSNRHPSSSLIPHIRSRSSSFTSPSSNSHFVLYTDAWTNNGNPPPPSQISGFNVVALSFYLASGPVDMAQSFSELSSSARQSILDEYKQSGISLIVSAFGSTDTPTSSGEDPEKLADAIASWTNKMGLAGVDVDYEDFDAFSAGTAEKWLITFTSRLRSQLGSDAIISHAPVAPWFTDDKEMYPGGGYLKVDLEVGDQIDWYNVQFYNQGRNEYTTCETLLTRSSAFPHASLFEIIDNGVPASRIVIGKPSTSAAANNGFMDTSTLSSCIAQAQAKGWNSGFMLWEFYGSPLTGLVDQIWGGGFFDTTSSSRPKSTVVSSTASFASPTTSSRTVHKSKTPHPRGSSTATTPTATSTGSANVDCSLQTDFLQATCGSGTSFRCALTDCCSSDGFCGSGDAWCGDGCQLGFGMCDEDPNPTCAA